MRLRSLLAFLVIQITGFLLWQGAVANPAPETRLRPDRGVALEIAEETLAASADTTEETADTTEETAPDLSHVRFSAKTTLSVDRPVQAERKQEVLAAMQMLPETHTKPLEHVILDYDPEARRGLGGKRLIILRGVNMEADETIAVLIHEVGHVVDLGMFTGDGKPSEFTDNRTPVPFDDMSLAFYRISWEDEITRKTGTDSLDFVSGYAMNDPFEDFAESYVFYVLHNQEFKEKARTSSHLLRKYAFMKHAVFKGREFDSGTAIEQSELFRRPWDITKLSFDLDRFLGREKNAA